jgi:alkanesulfonate monooxygenase SsuD/methylene tetrahydromethanopterin reductase-like flavin-dependent oxidoreductase (luciferase family)
MMVAANVIAADTDEEARLVATSLQQAFVNLRRGRPGLLPPPLPGFAERLTAPEQAILDDVLACSFIGSKETVKTAIRTFLDRTGADELMIAGMMFDHAARLRSFELAAEVRDELSR